MKHQFKFALNRVKNRVSTFLKSLCISITLYNYAHKAMFST